MKRGRIQYIHEKWDVLSYAIHELGWRVSKDGDRVISLAPGSENPTSLILHEKTWHDFKTGNGGDVIDLCAHAKYNGDKGPAIRELSAGYYDPHGQEKYDDWRQYTQELCNRIEFFHESLRPEDINYLHSRKINDETIERLKLGYNDVEDRLVIPYFKNGYIAYYAGRDRSGKPDASKYKKAYLDGFNENIPWGLHTLSAAHRAKFREKNLSDQEKYNIDKESILVIAEGAFDVMSFEQEGFKCLSPIGGFFSKRVEKYVLDLCKGTSIKRVFVCFDNDEAGNKFQLAMGELLFSNRIEFICGVLPQGIKDISDYYVGGGDLCRLVEQAVNGIEVLGERIKSKREFKAFIMEAAKRADAADIEAIFQKVKHFDKDWLSAVKSIAQKCPSEIVVVNSILRKHKLKYLEKAGFYEYLNGVWREKSDNEISSYFVWEMGKFAAGNKFPSLLRYLRSQVTTNEMFNRQNIFNFLNGVLDLETGELKPHSESYNSSIQMTYDYNESAQCPKWKKFIADVMCNDSAKMNLLQEIAGYVLFPDLRLQKCFFLMGDGGNGKSVYINVLRQVFGEDNCSSVPISNMGSQFEPIRLLNSLVNFMNETDTNLRDAEARFKAIVTGDKISACYKGKDFIEFNPRAVMISACNKFINTTDSTRGFLRRIIFVNFTRIFDGEDDNKNLTAELCQELPGIFNWCYEGYKRLMHTQEFTITPEHQELMEDFTTIIDPVMAYFQEELSSVTNEKYFSVSLYDEYVEWCKGAGHLPQSRQRFIRNIKQILKRERPLTEFGHSGGQTTIKIIQSEQE